MTDSKQTVRQVITELLEIVAWLAASLLPGTGRPWQPPQMSAEKRAELDAKARLERHATSDVVVHEIVPLGESPAPMDLDVMDLLVDILTVAEEVDGIVSGSAVVPRIPTAATAFADPSPYLEHARWHLAKVGACTEACALPGGCGHLSRADVEAAVLGRLEPLVFRAKSRLGLVLDGQLLHTSCPFCGGRTARHPVGGAKTLRTRLAADGEPLIVCESGRCEPGDANCGQRWRGMPAWSLTREGDWLAKCIEVHAKTVADVENVVSGLAS